MVGLPSPGHLPQYLALVTVGVFAYRGNWSSRLPGAAGWSGAALAQVMAESVLATGAVLALLVGFRRFADGSSRFTRWLSANAFAVYFLHPLVLVGVGMALSGWQAAALVKFAVMAVIAVPTCWALAAAVRALPGARRIL